MEHEHGMVATAESNLAIVEDIVDPRYYIAVFYLDEKKSMLYLSLIDPESPRRPFLLILDEQI